MTSRSGPLSTWGDQAVAEVYRAEWGRLLSLLVARTRRLDLAEDALSEAFARATAKWPVVGVPTNPGGWLYTTAFRLLLGRLRAEAIHGRLNPLLVVGSGWDQTPDVDRLEELDDERLSLVLLCCHPALHPAARSPLALRLVIGTTTEEIARLFLVSRSTMAARITRAKKKIVTAGIPLSRPVDDELRARLGDVCRTIYLAFTAGYAPGRGPELLRTDLAGEAVELASVLHRLVPDSFEAQALYGLLLVQHARRDARVQDGKLITLADQNRTLWHPGEQLAGTELISNLPPGEGYAEELRLQGLIAVEHARAPEAAATDWSRIASCYGRLEALSNSPIVRLNRAVAVAELEGAQVGLDMLDGLDEMLGANHRFHAVRADLARRCGRVGLARVAYQDALNKCDNDTEAEYLALQLAVLNETGP